MNSFKDIGDGIDKIHEIHEFVNKIDDLSTDDMLHRIEAIFIRDKNLLELKLSKKSFSLDVNFSVVKENIIHAAEWTELQMTGIKSVLEDFHHTAEDKYRAMIDYIKKHNHASLEEKKSPKRKN
jgi:hypothetical protein